MGAIGGFIVEARTGHHGDSDPLHNIAGKGYVVGKSKARDIRHDVVSAARRETLEAGAFEDAEHAIALDTISLGEALIVRVRQFERESSSRLQRRGSSDSKKIVHLANGLGRAG